MVEMSSDSAPGNGYLPPTPGVQGSPDRPCVCGQAGVRNPRPVADPSRPTLVHSAGVGPCVSGRDVADAALRAAHFRSRLFLSLRAMRRALPRPLVHVAAVLGTLEILYRCACGNRDSAPVGYWRSLPPCSAGCGRLMDVAGMGRV